MNRNRSSLKDRFLQLQRMEIERGRAWIYFLLYCGLITYMSHQPGDPMAVMPFPHFDKLIHFCEYFVFAILFQRALALQGIERGNDWSAAKLCALVLGVTAAFGAFDEVHQYFVPFRTMDILDWCADLLGASFGFLIFQAAGRSRQREVSDA